MAQLNLKSTVRIKKYRSYRGESGKAAPNVLERDFSATQPDEKWVTDVTEFKVKEQKVYLSPIVDLFTQEVVAYRVAKNACLPLVTDMLTEAISTLKPNSKPIIHSDQGWQYRHRQYQKKVAENGLTQSMSRKGNCLDNAVAENFFALLKTEMYHNQNFEDADALIEQIKEYIEYYNTKRIKVTFAKLYTTKTPITAADMLNDKVLPFFENHKLPMLRILTDRGTEYCGRVDQHDYQLYLAINDIDHTKTKAMSPQTNGICERFHKTILNEFYQVTFRKKLYGSMEELQKDLDEWMDYYNNHRTHQGKMCCGRTPIETLEDGKSIWAEKNLAQI